ncbi:MAG: Holliday junction resolvase RuvX, partial [Dehalococcoidales bacterium]
MALDVGDKWIGVALSDPGGILASPLTVIKREGAPSDIKAITDIIEDNQVEQIVVGLPRSMKGKVGRQAEKVHDFVTKLRSYTQVPIEFRDERLTTVLANRQIRAVGTKKSRGKIR